MHLLRRQAHIYTRAHTLHCKAVGRLEGLCYEQHCPKTPVSYIKLSTGHKLGPVVTLGGRVLNDIHHVGSNAAVVSTEDRPF